MWLGFIVTPQEDPRYVEIVYNRNNYFGFGSIPKPKPKLADTFGRYRNYILEGESSYR